MECMISLVKTNRKGLLGAIERDLLNDKPVAGLLRKFILLGGQAGSRELREWASKELRGYASGDELPSYRSIPAPIQMDGMSPIAQVWGQRLGVSELPGFARHDIDEHVNLTMGVGEIEALAHHEHDGDTSVKFSLPGARELARFMQQDAPSRIHIDALYWRVGRVAIEGVLDQIRTRLTELLAELRSLTSPTQEFPSAQQTDQAVNIVVRGFNPGMTVNAIVSGQGSSNAIDASLMSPNEKSGFWTTGKMIGAIMVGAAGIVSAVIAVLQFN